MNKKCSKPKLPHKNKKGYCSGTVCGFNTTYKKGSKNSELLISFCILDEKVKDTVNLELERLVEDSRAGLHSFELTYTYAILSFSGKNSGDLEGFITSFYPFLESSGVCGADICPICKRRISKADGVEKYINGIMFFVHRHCAIRTGLESVASRPEGLPELRKYKEDYEEEPTEVEERVSAFSIVKGIIGAIAGGLIGALFWSFIATFGWIVGLVGIVIILLVVKGYFLFGGEHNDFTIPIVMVVSVLSIVWGQILSAQIYFIHRDLTELTRMASIDNVPRIAYNYMTSSVHLEQFSLLYALGVVLALICSLMFLVALTNNSRR